MTIQAIAGIKSIKQKFTTDWTPASETRSLSLSNLSADRRSGGGRMSPAPNRSAAGEGDSIAWWSHKGRQHSSFMTHQMH
jgi:hypothetical protein